ncbi:arginase [Oryzomonas rubra]|uniref:Arginase n=1 Tax=Oryzomonas rubra TaxID=2509454 RepID=A0A5A9XI87_9BACT|nr:arginase [Oryzomonas rubra]KAA0891381.1 arginase [Oryzomonas rubra]
MSATIQIIGVPIDLGQTHRGVDMGPGAMRYAGLASRLAALGYHIRDIGNIAVPIRETLSEERQQHYLPAISQICRAAYEAGRRAVEEGAVPLFIGGDHTLAIGSIGGVTHNAPAGLIWIDAHADFNTPATTLTGNIHGMTLAALLGEGYQELVDVGRPGPKLEPADVVMIGIRDLDPEERTRLRESGITVYTMRDIDERGVGAVTREALERLEHRERLHVSLDMDCLDPQVCPGVGTTSPGGLSYREAQLLMEVLADSERVRALDVVEINPILDQRNQTAALAVELAASLFGKRIL